MDIKDKIAKLLALGESPNENEAKAALLKARELMAEYKLRPEEVQKAEDAKVIRQSLELTCTKMTDSWLSALCGIIAKHYCCVSYRHQAHNAKKVTMHLVGLEDDFALCKRVTLYAYDCVKTHCDRLRKEKTRQGWSARDIREVCNAYGAGFASGLRAAYQEQDKQHQEWGLILSVPQAVTAATSDLKKPKVYVKVRTDDWRKDYAVQGYMAGREFDPGTKLERQKYPEIA